MIAAYKCCGHSRNHSLETDTDAAITEAFISHIALIKILKKCKCCDASRWRSLLNNLIYYDITEMAVRNRRCLSVHQYEVIKNWRDSAMIRRRCAIRAWQAHYQQRTQLGLKSTFILQSCEDDWLNCHYCPVSLLNASLPEVKQGIFLYIDILYSSRPINTSCISHREVIDLWPTPVRRIGDDSARSLIFTI